MSGSPLLPTPTTGQSRVGGVGRDHRELSCGVAPGGAVELDDDAAAEVPQVRTRSANAASSRAQEVERVPTTRRVEPERDHHLDVAAPHVDLTRQHVEGRVLHDVGLGQQLAGPGEIGAELGEAPVVEREPGVGPGRQLDPAPVASQAPQRRRRDRALEVQVQLGLREPAGQHVERDGWAERRGLDVEHLALARQAAAGDRRVLTRAVDRGAGPSQASLTSAAISAYRSAGRRRRAGRSRRPRWSRRLAGSRRRTRRLAAVPARRTRPGGVIDRTRNSGSASRQRLTNRSLTTVSDRRVAPGQPRRRWRRDPLRRTCRAGGRCGSVFIDTRRNFTSGLVDDDVVADRRDLLVLLAREEHALGHARRRLGHGEERQLVRDVLDTFSKKRMRSASSPG